MKTKLQNTYQCDFCNKIYVRKHHAEIHESMCDKNPAIWRPCFGCKNLVKKEVEIWTGIDDYFSSEPIYKKVDFLYCKAKNQFLYTPKNEIKGNFHHIDSEGGNFENNPMPKECDIYNEQSMFTNIDIF